MRKQLFLEDFVSIKNGRIQKNGATMFSQNSMEITQFLKYIFKNLEISYPKFYKMDACSKLAFLAMEVLYERESPRENTALVFANSASSLETDKDFQESINTFPSPSIFVYTLPNIMLGELSIRHNLKTENIFFISQEFDSSLFTDYCNDLLSSQKAEEMVCGWVNLHNSEYDVFLCRVAQSGEVEFNEEELKKSYLSTHE